MPRRPAAQFSSSCALEEYKAHLHAAHNDHRFVCPSCGKLFKLRGSLLVHERIVHNPANALGGHACSACGATFNNKVGGHANNTNAEFPLGSLLSRNMRGFLWKFPSYFVASFG